jgi:drug/metabolite transporter (DMT)-like permease
MRNIKQIHILLILGVSFWAGNFVIGRYIHNEIEPLQLAFFRWAFVVLFLTPIFIKNFTTILYHVKKHFILLNILALISVTGYNTIIYLALHSTNVTNALLINSTTPIMILLLSYFILKTKIVFKQFIGVVLSLLGAIFLIIKGDINLLLNTQFVYGDIFVLLAGFAWAIYSIIINFKPKELHGITLLTILVYIGFFWLFLIYSFSGYSFIDDLVIVQNNLAVFLYISIFASILSYIFWNKGVEEIGADKTGQFPHLMPLIGSILAIIFLDEVLYLYHIVGGVMIAIGIYLSLFYKTKA